MCGNDQVDCWKTVIANILGYSHQASISLVLLEPIVPDGHIYDTSQMFNETLYGHILLAVLPVPIVYGALIDTTCLLWKTSTCSDVEGACLLYDREALRFKIHGLSVGCKTVATVMYFISYLCAERKLSRSAVVPIDRVVGCAQQQQEMNRVRKPVDRPST